jgi:glycosyltransferase involved in cell wall biosynthesis
VIIANFMDSSLLDLKRKGVLDAIPETYNPGRAYERVIHYTPHPRDIEVSDALRDHHIELNVHHVGGLQPLKFVRAVSQIWLRLGRDRVDLVRGRLPYLGSLMGAIAARLRGVPFVVSLGGDNRIPQESDGFYYSNRTVSYAIEEAVLRLARRIIVPNRYTLDYVARVIGERAARKRCVVIGWLSQPVPEFSPEDDVRLAKAAVPLDRPIIPIIGFVNRYKLSHVLFEVLEQGSFVDSAGRTVTFCFAGDGPLREEGERRLSGRADVLFLGWQQKPVVQALLRRAAVVAIPMSGFVLLEAASLGKPVVTSSIEWHGELVESGVSGLLVNPIDPIAWRAAIAQLLANPVAAADMGVKIKAAYWKNHSPEACQSAEHRLYEQLTGKRVAA